MTSAPPFQFSLRMAFVAMATIALVLAAYRMAGALAAIMTAIGVLHLNLIGLLAATPLPWNPAREELWKACWFMMLPYPPFGMYLLLSGMIRVQLAPASNQMLVLIASGLMLLTIFAVPVAVLCGLRVTRLVDPALADQPHLKEPFRWVAMLVIAGTLVFLCGTCGWQ